MLGGCEQHFRVRWDTVPIRFVVRSWVVHQSLIRAIIFSVDCKFLRQPLHGYPFLRMELLVAPTGKQIDMQQMQLRSLDNCADG